jgi:hypothetical protein
MNFVLRIFVNIVAIFVLVILISLPTVLSVGFFKFDPQILWHGLEISSQKSNFGNYLDIKKKESGQDLSFSLEVTRFPQKDAFYKNVVTVKNGSGEDKNLEIVKNNQDFEIFFAENDEKSGPKEINLKAGEAVVINVLVGKSENEEKQSVFDFSLKD